MRFFIDLFNPEYNILKTAGNLLGYIHSEEAKKKISEAKIGQIVSEETRKKMSEAKRDKTGDKSPFFGLIHSDETKNKMSDALGTTIFVFSLQSELLYTFPSSGERAAGKHFNSNKSTKILLRILPNLVLFSEVSIYYR